MSEETFEKTFEETFKETFEETFEEIPRTLSKCCYITAGVPDPHSPSTLTNWTFHVCVCVCKGASSRCPICGSIEPDCGVCAGLPQYTEPNIPGLIPVTAVIREADVLVIGVKLPPHLFKDGRSQM